MRRHVRAYVAASRDPPPENMDGQVVRTRSIPMGSESNRLVTAGQDGGAASIPANTCAGTGLPM